MIDIKNKEDCCGCKACIQICPKKCIDVDIDNEGFWYPEVDINRCIDCGLCEKVCPELADLKKREPIKCYAAKNQCDEIRLKSSSGGVFTELARLVLDKKGVVFGAEFDNNWNVVHGFTETFEELSRFRGSKYVQSDTAQSFKQAKEYLDSGRYVLFTGTPCQIAGLSLFLRKEYSNLITMDFICHGVPSPEVWSLYLKKIAPKYKIIKISFRNKYYGWKRFSMNIKDSNNNVILETLDKNIYMKGFLKDLYLRPSCHSCSVKGFKSTSDITVGDYWGVNSIIPQVDDDKGLSAVMLNTRKGHDLYNALSIFNVETTLTDIKRNNPSIFTSVAPHKSRLEFFDKYKTVDLTEVISLLIKEPPFCLFKRKVKYLIKTILIKLRIL